MKSVFKKLTALALTVVLSFGASSFLFAFAGENEQTRFYPSIVIPGLFQSDVRLYDENGVEMTKADGTPYERPFFLDATDDIIKNALEQALAPVAKLLILQKDKEHKAAKAIAGVIGNTVAGKIKCDSNGKFIYNVRAVEYNTALSNLSAYDRAFALNAIPLNDYVQKVGLDYLYFYSYVSVGSIKDLAEGLYDLIQIAKAETGAEKVNLAPISQGGAIFNALMQLYKDRGLEISDDIHRVVLVVPAADGAAILGDVYHYGLLDDAEALYGYMFPSILGEDQQWLAYLINLLLRYFPNADLTYILDQAVYTLIEDYLENSTALWALIPSKDYPDLRETYLLDPEDEYIRREADWYYNAQLHHREYILEAVEKGVAFFDIVNYNFALYPICDSWDKVNADGVIHTESESLGAYSVAPAAVLPEDYVQANTYCTDPAHNHIDSFRKVDASAGILAETTFYFYGQAHTMTASNDVIIRLASRILSDDSFRDVYSDPNFPQFNFARHSGRLKGLYYAWADFDAGVLKEDLRVQFLAAMADAKAAIDSTYMPTEEFDAVYETLRNVTYKIENGSAPQNSTSRFITFITKYLKFLSDVLLRLFGGKGYSDLLFFR